MFDGLDTRVAESKWANVCDFVTWLGKRGEDDGRNLLELTQTVALLGMLDKNDKDQDAVQLATLHAAKGLEFRHVFLVGIEEDILPHREASAEGRIEEERRLMYVGITRARHSLHVTHCGRRKAAGAWRPREPSRFIDEMGGDLRRSGGNDPDVPEDRQAGRAKFAQFKALLGNT